MSDYANTREFIRSVPASFVAAARRERILDVVLAALCGTGLGVMLALAI